MPLNVDPFLRTITTLEQVLIALQRLDNNDILYDLYRNAAIKSLELSLEAIGKLLRETLKSYSGNSRAVDGLVFNDVLRMAGRHGLLDMDGVERWLAYRANSRTALTAILLRTTMGRVLLIRLLNCCHNLLTMRESWLIP